MPQEYIDYRFCKDIWHCTPEEMLRQDQDTYDLHLQFWNMEQEVAEAHKSDT